LINSTNGVVLADIVLLVVYGSASIKSIISNFRRWPGAVTAEINGSTVAINQVVSSILLTRRVRDSIVKGIEIDLTWVSSIAGASSLTVDNDLGIKTNWRGGQTSIQDVESVSDG
jgi:hypothetical protein